MKPNTEACIGHFGIRDIGLFFKGYWDILGYRIFRNFGIWDIGIYFGIREINFGIWDIFDGLFWDMGYCLPP